MSANLFDRNLLRQRRQRALARPIAGADFILQHVIADLVDRLSAIKRIFPLALDMAAATPALGQALLHSGQITEIVRLDGAPAAFSQSGLCVIGDEEWLPFAPRSFDLAVSALALQHVNDVPGVLAQIRRALKADGLFVAVTLGGQSLRELRQVLAEAESEISGGVSPRLAPFVDVRDMGALMQRAGFALPVCDSEILTVRYGDLFALMRDLRAMGATNALIERSRAPLPRAILFRAAQLYAQHFAQADGRIPARFELVWAMGWVPHDSQQQPLKPGSATARLADALKAREMSAGEVAGVITPGLGETE